jgi:hypothetical protein
MKLKEITPEYLRCVIGTCPAVYETDRGTYILIGKVVKSADIGSSLAERIGPDETVVEIPKELVSNLTI